MRTIPRSALNSIFDRFDINGKVFFITTDGAGEYRAALKCHGDNYLSIQPWIGEREDVDECLIFDPLLNNDQSDSSVQQPRARTSTIQDHELELNSEPEMIHEFLMTRKRQQIENTSSDSDSFEDIDPPDFSVDELFTLNFTSLDDVQLKNMNLIDCSAHKLDKLGECDAIDALDDETYSQMHKQVFDFNFTII